MKSSKFKLLLILSMVMLILCCSITAYAAAGDPAKPDKILKYTIGNDIEKHELEHSGTDNLVSFTLPEAINQDSDWVADYMEVMLMERLKGETDFEPMIKLDSSDEMRAIVEIEGLDVTLNLGNSENYRTGAQYQILYRVHMACINDPSLSAWNIPSTDYVGSEDYTDMDDPDLGWTLLTNNGEKFIIYTNSDPTGEVTYLIKSETLNVKPAVDPSTLGGSPKVAITKSSGNLTMQARQHFHQPYAQDFRIFADNYSSVTQAGVYKDVIRAYTADAGSTARKYKWYVTGGTKLNGNIPLNRSAVVSSSNSAQPSASSSIVTNESGWDGMGNASGSSTSYIMMELVCNSGTQDAYMLTDIDYRAKSSVFTSAMTSAMGSCPTTDDGYGNWAKTNKYLSGIIMAKDEDDGDMLGIKILVSGTSDYGTSYDDYEVYDSGSIIYPNTEFEYKADLASKIEDGHYKYKIYIYDDNGGEFEFENEATGGYVTLLTSSDVRIMTANSQASATDKVKWANEMGTVSEDVYKTFRIRLNNDAYAKKLIGGNNEVKVRTQYTMYNSVSNDIDNRYMVSRSTMLGMDIGNSYSMRPHYIDKAYVMTSGNQWRSNYNVDADSTTTRLLSHANAWKHAEDEKITMYEDGLYGIVVSCNDIYGNYVEKTYGTKTNAVRIDGHKPYVDDIDSSIPLSDTFTDNSSISWIKPLDEDGVLTVGAEDTVATIGGVQYYSGVEELKVYRTTLDGHDMGNTEDSTFTATMETEGDMADISYAKYAEFDIKEVIPSQDGIYWFEIIPVDFAGNMGETVDKYVGVDGSGPVIDPLASDITNEGFTMIKNNATQEILDRNTEVDYVTDWVDYKPNLKYGVLINDIGSGVGEVHYGVSNEATAMTGAWNSLNLESSSWLETEAVNRTGIANLDLGNCGAGIKYLHIKAFDVAGNESVSVIKLKLNSIPEINSVSVDDTSRSGIYKTLEADVAPNGVKTYIVYKSADYSAFRLNILDADVTDEIEIKYTLTNNETGNVMVEGTKVFEGPQDGSVGVAKAFMVNYQDSAGNDLPDGIYTLAVEFTDIKIDTDFDGIAPYNGKYNMPYREDSVIPTVQVVLKRAQPPVPQITVNVGTDEDGVDCKIVSIEYPLETGVLNCPELNALILEKYSTSTRRGATPFIDYVAEFNVYETTNVVAQYTDCAGNISTNSLQVLMEGLPEPEDNINISEGGSDVVVDESRASNTYYIGTRKENDAGINSSEVFSFIN